MRDNILIWRLINIIPISFLRFLLHFVIKRQKLSYCLKITRHIACLTTYPIHPSIHSPGIIIPSLTSLLLLHPKSKSFHRSQSRVKHTFMHNSQSTKMDQLYTCLLILFQQLLTAKKIVN